MRIIVLLNIILFTSSNSFSQNDKITFNYNGYAFQTEINSIIDYFQLNADSVDFYTNKLREVNSKESELTYDSVIEFGTLSLTFHDILLIIRSNHSLVKIKRVSDDQLVKYKVKLKTEENSSNGIGGSSKTFLTLIDKKKRVQILRELISLNLAC